MQTKKGDMVYFNLCKLVQKGCGNRYSDNFAMLDKDGTCTELTDGNIGASLSVPSQSETGLQGISIERLSAVPCP